MVHSFLVVHTVNGDVVQLMLVIICQVEVCEIFYGSALSGGNGKDSGS